MSREFLIAFLGLFTLAALVHILSTPRPNEREKACIDRGGHPIATLCLSDEQAFQLIMKGISK